jgi:nickel transport protein
VKRALVIVALLLVPLPAQAHEVLHTIERGKAIAVKAYFADGEALAYTEYQVFSSADAKIPYQKGRTDRAGYLAFVPDTPGKWRVKVSDNTGHGLDLDVESVAIAPVKNDGGRVATWAFALRPIIGVLLIAALFVTLVWIYRRKGSGK